MKNKWDILEQFAPTIVILIVLIVLAINEGFIEAIFGTLMK